MENKFPAVRCHLNLSGMRFRPRMSLDVPFIYSEKQPRILNFIFPVCFDFSKILFIIFLNNHLINFIPGDDHLQ